MEIIFKETTLKIRKEERVNIISIRVEYCNLNLTLILHKFLRFI